MEIGERDFVSTQNWEFSSQWVEYRPKLQHPSMSSCIVPIEDSGKFRPIVDHDHIGPAFDSIPDAAEWAWEKIEELREIAYQNQPEATMSMDLF